MQHIQSKLPNVGTTIFSVMSKLAADTGAINLSQGFPNFPVEEEFIRAYHQVLDENTHQYAPMPGLPGLTYAIAEKIQRHYGRTIQPESEILVTAGATQALFTAIMALVHPGEEVIVLDPSYDCYAPAVELCGARPIHVNLNIDFSVDWSKVEAAITHKTSMLIINNPHNPGGTVFRKSDFDALETLVAKNPRLFLISDEVYEYIHFEEPHISVNSLPHLRERAIITSSFGKTFHVTGWKIGYLTAPAEIMSEIKKVHQFNVFSVNSTAQYTLARYLPKADLSQLSLFYQQKRDFFRTLIEDSKFELMDCHGSYFQVARYSEVSNLPDTEFAIEMTKKHGVAVIPISVFNNDQHDDQLIRFCFAKDDETLLKAAERLCRI
jgi:methionine transaminase